MALADLITNAPKRERMARSWRMEVGRKYSLAVNLENWPAAWVSIINDNRSRRRVRSVAVA